MQHLRLAARALLRAPVFTVAVVGSLGISIGAITTVVSVADAVLFRPLAFEDPDRLVWITSVRRQRSDAPFSLPEFMDYAQQATSTDVAAFTSWSASLATPTVARRLQGMRISANAFGVLGVKASAGRLLAPDDDRPDAPDVAVLSTAFWREHHGGSRAVIGQFIRLNDRPYRIVGVLPPHFPLPLRPLDVVVPLKPDNDPSRYVRSSTNFLQLFGRLRPTATLALARQEFNVMAGRLRADHPAEYAAKLGVALTPMQEFLVGSTRQIMVVMLGAAALLLLIALANVLNLLLVRGIARQGEMVLRRALGGSTTHLAGTVTLEAGLLAGLGSAAGTLMAYGLVRVIAASSLALPRIDEVRLSAATLGLLMAVAGLATLLFGAVTLGTALRAAPRQALAASGRGLHGGRHEARLRSAFLVSQVGLATLLTIVTATLARSLARLQATDLGFRPDAVLVARVALPPAKYPSVERVARAADAVEQELRTAPGIVAAGVISIAPLSGNLAMVPFSVAGSAGDRRDDPMAHLRAISPGYLDAVRATVIRGRGVRASDHAEALPVAVVSQALAERHLAGRDPIGQQLLIDDNDVGPRPVTIVGVLATMRHVSVQGPAPVDIYLPLAQIHPGWLPRIAGSQYWAVRFASPATAGGTTILNALVRIDRDIAVARIEPMDAFVGGALSSRRWSVAVLLGFAVVALLLATAGAYGVVAYSVAQRRREIGLRMALGATPGAVLRAFLQPALRLTLLGVGLGIVGAIATRKVVAGLLFGVTATEPVVLAIVGMLLMLASGTAAVVPARRAAALGPGAALGEARR